MGRYTLPQGVTATEAPAGEWVRYEDARKLVGALDLAIRLMDGETSPQGAPYARGRVREVRAWALPQDPKEVHQMRTLPKDLDYTPEELRQAQGIAADIEANVNMAPKPDEKARQVADTLERDKVAAGVMSTELTRLRAAVLYLLRR